MAARRASALGSARREDHPRAVDPRPPLGGHSRRSHAGQSPPLPRGQTPAQGAPAESHVNEIPAQRTQSRTESARSLGVGRGLGGRGLHEGRRGLDSAEQRGRGRTAPVPERGEARPRQVKSREGLEGWSWSCSDGRKSVTLPGRGRRCPGRDRDTDQPQGDAEGGI